MLLIVGCSMEDLDRHTSGGATTATTSSSGTGGGPASTTGVGGGAAEGTTGTGDSLCYGGGSGELLVADVNSGSCYRFVAEPLSWSQAEAECEQWGGRLAAIMGPPEQTFLFQDVLPGFYDAEMWTNELWLGGSDADAEGEWTWTTGEAFSFNGGWAPGHPDASVATRDCLVVFEESDWSWADVDCETYKSFLCER